MKFSFKVFILSFYCFLFSNSSYSISKNTIYKNRFKDFSKLSHYQQIEIHSAIVKAAIVTNSRQVYPKYDPRNHYSFNYFFNNFMNSLMNTSVAGGEKVLCNFGGWPSYFQNVDYKASKTCIEPFPSRGLKNGLPAALAVFGDTSDENSYNSKHYCGSGKLFRCYPKMAGPGIDPKIISSTSQANKDALKGLIPDPIENINGVIPENILPSEGYKRGLCIDISKGMKNLTSRCMELSRAIDNIRDESWRTNKYLFEKVIHDPEDLAKYAAFQENICENENRQNGVSIQECKDLEETIDKNLAGLQYFDPNKEQLIYCDYAKSMTKAPACPDGDEVKLIDENGLLNLDTALFFLKYLNKTTPEDINVPLSKCNFLNVTALSDDEAKWPGHKANQCNLKISGELITNGFKDENGNIIEKDITFQFLDSSGNVFNIPNIKVKADDHPDAIYVEVIENEAFKDICQKASEASCFKPKEKKNLEILDSYAEGLKNCGFDSIHFSAAGADTEDTLATVQEGERTNSRNCSFGLSEQLKSYIDENYKIENSEGKIDYSPKDFTPTFKINLEKNGKIQSFSFDIGDRYEESILKNSVTLDEFCKGETLSVREVAQDSTDPNPKVSTNPVLNKDASKKSDIFSKDCLKPKALKNIKFLDSIIDGMNGGDMNCGFEHIQFSIAEDNAKVSTFESQISKDRSKDTTCDYGVTQKLKKYMDEVKGKPSKRRNIDLRLNVVKEGKALSIPFNFNEYATAYNTAMTNNSAAGSEVQKIDSLLYNSPSFKGGQLKDFCQNGQLGSVEVGIIPDEPVIKLSVDAAESGEAIFNPGKDLRTTENHPWREPSSGIKQNNGAPIAVVNEGKGIKVKEDFASREDAKKACRNIAILEKSIGNTVRCEIDAKIITSNVGQGLASFNLRIDSDNDESLKETLELVDYNSKSIWKLPFGGKYKSAIKKLEYNPMKLISDKGFSSPKKHSIKWNFGSTDRVKKECVKFAAFLQSEDPSYQIGCAIIGRRANSRMDIVPKNLDNEKLCTLLKKYKNDWGCE